MSSIARWMYNRDLTVWPAESFDDFGQPTSSAPYLLKGTWEQKSMTKMDDDGNEFISDTIYRFELLETDPLLPKRQDKIARGDLTASPLPTDDAEVIRKIEGDDMTMFGASEIPDWAVIT